MNPDYVFPADEYLLLGKVAKVHGLNGELKIYLYSDIRNIEYTKFYYICYCIKMHFLLQFLII